MFDKLFHTLNQENDLRTMKNIINSIEEIIDELSSEEKVIDTNSAIDAVCNIFQHYKE